MQNRKILITIAVISILINIFLFIDSKKFPIKYQVCDSGYTDCRTVSKFKDMDMCQFETRQGDWYCDESDPNNIQCHVAKPGESSATALCTK